jgi:hypothetical protein
MIVWPFEIIYDGLGAFFKGGVLGAYKVAKPKSY